MCNRIYPIVQDVKNLNERDIYALDDDPSDS